MHAVGPQHYRNYYIADSDSRYSELDIGKELLSIGAFDKIVYNDGPEKARSRLELLASTCRFEKRNNGGGYYYMHRLCKRKFQKIKEVSVLLLHFFGACIFINLCLECVSLIRIFVLCMYLQYFLTFPGHVLLHSSCVVISALVLLEIFLVYQYT